MSTQASILKLVRQAHLYLGIFIVPAILFFAFTGALQTFSLHESAKDGAYKPAHWIVVLAEIHKKQTAQVPPPKIQTQQAVTPEADGHHKSGKAVNSVPAAAQAAHGSLPLKIFFHLVSVGLFISTFSGLYMSYKYSRSKLLVGILLLAGIVVLIVLIRP